MLPWVFDCDIGGFLTLEACREGQQEPDIYIFLN
jgi:hypothetical protein